MRGARGGGARAVGGGRRAAPAWLLALAVSLLPACGPASERAAAPAGEPAGAVRGEPDAGPEVVGSHDPRLAVRLDRLERGDRDLVVAHLTFENRGQAPIEVGTAFAFQPEDDGFLSAVFVADASGLKRYFPLRDAGGAPQTSRFDGPIAPGEQREAWARFGPVSAEVEALMVQVPGFPALPHTRVRPGADAARD
jgi:hypothetical protein